MIDLNRIFSDLKSSSKLTSDNPNYFVVNAIPDYPTIKIGKDQSNRPCLLVEVRQRKEESLPTSVKLANLSVIYNINCRLRDDNKVIGDGKYTVICCSSFDQAIQHYFLRAIGGIIPIIGTDPTYPVISNTIDKLVALFSAISKAPQKSIQGLWAELLLISLSTNPVFSLQSWHQSPLDRYDFCSESQRIEVKSSTVKERKHKFSLEQIRPDSDLDVVIASIFVERVGSGTSVADLVDSIKERIGHNVELVFYLEFVVGTTLGENWELAAKDKFDYDLAKKSINFYHAKDIPSINNIPSEISDVHFQVDMKGVSVIPNSLLRQNAKLFQAIIPRKTVK